MVKLSPADPTLVVREVMAGRIGKCGYYVIMLAYVDEMYPFVRLVRRLEEAGARLEYMDEVERRIVADIPASIVNNLMEGLLKEKALASIAFEVKSSCRHNVDVKVLKKILKDLGFIVSSKSSNREVYIGKYKNRAIEVEAENTRVRIKIGRMTMGKPRPPIPPSLFLLEPGEVNDAYSVLEDFVNELRVKVRGERASG